ncbi:terminase [Sphingomonas koreensis]|uniref:Terminase n=1 Tax=Sphingomonas koreensis TaxID=93064 RepID=A0A430G2D1_9SPHN|nr:terminase [Sphingomonas koreensis]RSY83128.1 terminase [Sphingomonas koreensis]
MLNADPELALIEDIASFTHDPVGYVHFAFPWESDRLPEKGPRAWQHDTLNIIGEHLSNPETRFDPLRIAVASGHGIGKSALISMIAAWGLDTCEDCKVVVTANTEPQLRTKTMPEISKWRKLSITSHWFKVNAQSIVSLEKGRSDQWRLDAVTWSKENTEAFAGLHNKGKRIIVIYDEASGIDDKVWEVTLGALTDEETEIIWIAFGNPTKNTGEFRWCFGKNRALWKTRQIDSRTVEGTNKTYLSSLVVAYGIGSDIVKVRVLGQFPSASSMQFIGSDVVEAARVRPVPKGLLSDPLIFGVDCARFGGDHSTLAIRCGKDARTRPWKRWHQIDSMTVAGDVMLEAQMWKPDAIFVDVGNIGGGVIDRLRQLGARNVIEVHFGGTGGTVEWASGVHIATQNKRAQMWASMRAWLRGGGVIPDEQVIEDDLTGIEYAYSGEGETEIVLEKKKHMKARGLASPDDGDALACTFAFPVAPRTAARRDPANYIAGNPSNYDRFAELDQ